MQQQFRVGLITCAKGKAAAPIAQSVDFDDGLDFYCDPEGQAAHADR